MLSTLLLCDFQLFVLETEKEPLKSNLADHDNNEQPVREIKASG